MSFSGLIINLSALSALAVGFNIHNPWLSIFFFAIGGVLWGMSLHQAYRKGGMATLILEHKNMHRVGLGKLHSFMLKEYIRRTQNEKVR